MVDNSLALDKLQKEQKDLENQRTTLQNQLYAITGALNFCTYLIGVITKPPAEEAVEAENMNGADLKPSEGGVGDPNAPPLPPTAAQRRLATSVAD